MESNIIKMPMRKLVSGRWLAERIGVSYSTIKLWSRLGKLDDYQIKIGSRTIKYEPERIENAIKSGRFAKNAA